MRAIGSENDGIRCVGKKSLYQRGECGVVVRLLAFKEHIRVPHHEVVERHAKSRGRGEIHNTLRPLTEGFYDTALNEGHWLANAVLPMSRLNP